MEFKTAVKSIAPRLNRNLANSLPCDYRVVGCVEFSVREPVIEATPYLDRLLYLTSRDERLRQG